MDDLIATYYFRPKSGVTADFAAQAISLQLTTSGQSTVSPQILRHKQFLRNRRPVRGPLFLPLMIIPPMFMPTMER